MIRFADYGYGQFDRHTRIGPAVWPHFDLLFIHRGRISLTLSGGEPVILGPRRGILIYPNTQFVGHSLTPVARASIQHFKILPGKDPLPATLARLVGLRRGYELYADPVPPQTERDIDRAVRFASAPRTGSHHDTRVALLILILAQIETQREHGKGTAAATPEWLQPLLAWLDTQRGRPLTVNDMAEHAGLSPSHLRAMFTAAVGQTPRRFLLNQRMLEARRLLCETLTPIKQIGRAAGYSDSAHFYRAFTALTRMTPQAYRNRYAPRG